MTDVLRDCTLGKLKLEFYDMTGMSYPFLWLTLSACHLNYFGTDMNERRINLDGESEFEEMTKTIGHLKKQSKGNSCQITLKW